MDDREALSVELREAGMLARSVRKQLVTLDASLGATRRSADVAEAALVAATEALLDEHTGDEGALVFLTLVRAS